MAREYELPGGYEGLWQPTPADRIIGAEESKRSTKSFMPDAKFAILLASIRNHAESVTRAVQELDHDEWHEAPSNGVRRLPCHDGVLADRQPCAGLMSFRDLGGKYPGVRVWFNIHQEIVEHMASHEGFSLRVVAKLAALAEEGRREPESSVKAGAPTLAP